MLSDWCARSLPLSTLVLLALLDLSAASQTPLLHKNSDCLHSASAAQINHLLRTGGAGAEIILCPEAHIAIDPHGVPITFTAAKQSIYTLGLPEDHSRATIQIVHPKGHFNGDLTTAIKADCDECSGVVIKNVYVDGGRGEMGGLEGGDALILVGGLVGEQEVRHVEASSARGYAVVHAGAGPEGTCHSVTIADSVFHSSGDAPLDLMLNSELARLRRGVPPSRGRDRPGKWTDGISVACQQSTISGNVVRDVSGVGIALRGAPGTQVTTNSIVARDRDMLVGIAIVANPVFTAHPAHDGGVIVRDNSIHAASAMIRVGISTGSGAWSTDEQPGDHEIAYGSEIVRNRLSSYTGYYGYAIAISDARAILVTENSISAAIWGVETSACYTSPAFTAPTPLLRDPRSVIGHLQPEFADQHYAFLLCVGPGSPSSTPLSRHTINEVYAAQAARKGRNGNGKPVGGGVGREEVHPGRVMMALQRKRAGRMEPKESEVVKGEKGMRKRTLSVPRAPGHHVRRRS